MSSTNQPTKTDDDDVEGGGGAAAATIKILSIYLSHNTDTIRSFSFRQHSNSLFFSFICCLCSKTNTTKIFISYHRQSLVLWSCYLISFTYRLIHFVINKHERHAPLFVLQKKKTFLRFSFFFPFLFSLLIHFFWINN